ncbi:hypothetical protein [Haloferax elongans]|uniref:hypothetical protein n=1 Tax=Haloferax elongans TaxID=403191 RepID=UPI000ADDF3BB|nr:hypothetical protein [Haloferax elongans]
MSDKDPTHHPVTEEEYELMRRRIAEHFDKMRALMDEAITADLEELDEEAE